MAALPALAGILLLAAGCMRTGDFQEEVEAELARESAGIGQQLAAPRLESRTGISHAGRPWYGAADNSMRPRQAGDPRGVPLPGWLEKRDAVAVTIGAAVPVGEAASIVSAVAGIPVAVVNTVTDADGQAVEVPVRGGRAITHVGRLSALLDRIAGEYDLSWRYDGRQVRLLAMDTRGWTVPLPIGNTEISASSGGLSGGGDRSVSLSSSSSQNPWAALTAQLREAVRPPARALAVPDNGRVMVTARPSDIAAAEAIIADWIRLYSQRITLEVGIYQIDAERAESFQAGLRTRSAADSGSGAAPGVQLDIRGDGSASIIGAVSGRRLQLDFQALAGNDSVLAYRTASTVAQSGTPAPVIMSSVHNYVSSIETTEAGVSVDTESIDDGLSLHMVPRLIRNGDEFDIQLNLVLMQNEFVRLDRFGEVQLPSVDQRMISSQILLKPGETLVLSGYEQASLGADRMGGLLSTGREASSNRIMLMVMVRPSLSPA